MIVTWDGKWKLWKITIFDFREKTIGRFLSYEVKSHDCIIFSLKNCYQHERYFWTSFWISSQKNQRFLPTFGIFSKAIFKYGKDLLRFLKIVLIFGKQKRFSKTLVNLYQIWKLPSKKIPTVGKYLGFFGERVWLWSHLMAIKINICLRIQKLVQYNSHVHHYALLQITFQLLYNYIFVFYQRLYSYFDYFTTIYLYSVYDFILISDHMTFFVHPWGLLIFVVVRTHNS